MRSHKDMADNVIRRRNAFLEQKKRRRAMLLKTVSASVGTAAVVLFGFALWNDDLIENMRPDPHKYPVVTDYPTAAVTEPFSTQAVTTPAVTQSSAANASYTVTAASAATQPVNAHTTAPASARTTADAPVITPSQTHRPASSSSAPATAVRTKTAAVTAPVPPTTIAPPLTSAPTMTTTAKNELPTTTVSRDPVIVTAVPSLPRTEAPTTRTTKEHESPPTTRRSSTVPHIPVTGDVTVAHSTATVPRSSAVPPDTEIATVPATTTVHIPAHRDYVEEFWYGGWWTTDVQSNVPDSAVGPLLDSLTIGEDQIRADIFDVEGYGDDVIGVRFNWSERMYLCYRS